MAPFYDPLLGEARRPWGRPRARAHAHAPRARRVRDRRSRDAARLPSRAPQRAVLRGGRHVRGDRRVRGAGEEGGAVVSSDNDGSGSPDGAVRATVAVELDGRRSEVRAGAEPPHAALARASAIAGRATACGGAPDAIVSPMVDRPPRPCRRGGRGGGGRRRLHRRGDEDGERDRRPSARDRHGAVGGAGESVTLGQVICVVEGGEVAPPRRFCSDVSREHGEPLAATASRVDRWILIEHHGAWGRTRSTRAGSRPRSRHISRRAQPPFARRRCSSFAAASAGCGRHPCLLGLAPRAPVAVVDGRRGLRRPFGLDFATPAKCWPIRCHSSARTGSTTPAARSTAYRCTRRCGTSSTKGGSGSARTWAATGSRATSSACPKGVYYGRVGSGDALR